MDDSDSVQGLATVALLKSYYDRGQDYFQMFVPFVENAIENIGKRRFTLGDVKQSVSSQYSLTIPDHTLKKLVGRCVKNYNDLNRHEGHYVIDGDIPTTDIQGQRENTKAKLNKLANALQEYAEDRGVFYTSSDDAAASLFNFIRLFQQNILLDKRDPYRESGSIDKETKVIARFIHDKCSNNPGLYSCLDIVLKGYTLQDAMFLRNLSTPEKTFNDLTVYLDSGFLFGLLGYEGKSHERAYNETVSLLKKTGASLRCFERTIAEMKRVLEVYEHKLATSERREDLYQTPLTRYFLHHRKTPSDIEQIIALLENNILEYGIEIDLTPDRVDKYTLDEEKLAEMLSDDNGELDTYSDRVKHDVDCTAAIVTLRRKHEPDRLSNARAVFASTSVRMVRTVKEWYEDEDMSGVSSVLTMSEIANRAWLKQPSAASDLKMNELVALCYSALRPSENAWKKFLSRLEDLVESGEIGSDEAAAIVASRITDKSLSKAEEQTELDESSLDDVIYRVKKKYKEEADERVEKVRREANQQVEEAEEERERISNELREQNKKTEKLESSLHRLIKLVSYVSSSIIFYTCITIIAIASFARVPNLLYPFNVPRIVSNGLITVLIILAFLNISYGVTLNKARYRIENYLEKKIRDYI